jgi:hypothetical protein
MVKAPPLLARHTCPNCQLQDLPNAGLARVSERVGQGGVSQASMCPPGQEGGPSDLKRYREAPLSEAGGGANSKERF